MIKFILSLVLSILLAGNAFASWTNFDYTPVAKASAIDGANNDDFAEILPTSDADVIEIQYRIGTDRETSAGDIYNLTYTISTDTYGSPASIFECPTASLDATNPTPGQIGTTLYSLVNCKDTGNTDSQLYLGTRSLSGAISTWSFSSIYDPANTANGWSRLVSTSDSDTYFFTISQNSPGVPITQLRTTDAGASWSIGPTIISSPSYYSEAACAYVPSYGHICIVRNDNGSKITYIKSTDDGLTWTDPVLTNIGGATGVKISHLYYDSATNNLLLFFADRSDSILYGSVTKPSKAFAGTWETPRNLATSVTLDAVAYEIDSTLKKYLVLIGSTTGTNGHIDDMQYRGLTQEITFGQIGP